MWPIWLLQHCFFFRSSALLRALLLKMICISRMGARAVFTLSPFVMSLTFSRSKAQNNNNWKKKGEIEKFSFPTPDGTHLFSFHLQRIRSDILRQNEVDFLSAFCRWVTHPNWQKLFSDNWEKKIRSKELHFFKWGYETLGTFFVMEMALFSDFLVADT